MLTTEPVAAEGGRLHEFRQERKRRVTSSMPTQGNEVSSSTRRYPIMRLVDERLRRPYIDGDPPCHGQRHKPDSIPYQPGPIPSPSWSLADRTRATHQPAESRTAAAQFTRPRDPDRGLVHHHLAATCHAK